MKKILLALTAGLLLASCYQDLGNYDYNFDNMNHLDVKSIAFMPNAYATREGYVVEIQQPRENQTRRVEVSFDQSLKTGPEDLEFFWERSYKQGGKNRKDTTYTKGYVEVNLPANTPMSYTIRLIITDPSTTLQYYSSVIIRTRPAYKNSLFILHGPAGDRRLGNIEQIGPLKNVVTDAFDAIYPDSVQTFFRNGVAMMYAPFVDFAGQKRRMAILSDNGTGRVWDPYGLDEPSKLRPFSNYCFPNNPLGLNPRQIVGLGDYESMKEHKLIIDRSGQFYVSCQFLCFWQANFAPPTWNPKHQNDYMVEVGTIMPEMYVLWDAKYQRFLVQAAMVSWQLGDYDDQAYSQTPYEMNTIEDAHVDFTALGDLSPVGKKAVYAFIRSSWDEDIYMAAHPLFIFQDTQNDRFILYDLTPLISEKGVDDIPVLMQADDRLSLNGDDWGGDWGDEDATPRFAITAKVLPNFSPGNLSNILYSHSFSTNLLFYSDGGNVYRYNTVNGELYPVYSAPDGYVVSTMKFRTTYSTTQSGFLGRYLDIALLKEADNTGAVMSVRFDNAGDVDEGYKHELVEVDDAGNKFGPIVDICFVHDYLMEQAMYEAEF